MRNASNEQSTGAAIVKLWIIWAGFAGTLIAYVAIPVFAGDMLRRNISADIPLGIMRTALLGIGAITLIGAHFLRKRIIKGVDSDPMALKPQVPPDVSDFVKRYTMAMIISLALAESVGIYGLVLFFLGDDFSTLFTFVGISAAAMFVFRPKAEGPKDPGAWF